MATSNINAVQYGIFSEQGMSEVHAPVTPGSFAINQGDLCYLDTSTHIAKALDSDAHAASLLGIALQPTAVSSNLDNSSAPAEKGIMVGWNCVANLKTTAAETYVPGTLVYAGADAQTITTVTGTNRVGIVILPLGVASVTGAANVRVGVVIKSAVY